MQFKRKFICQSWFKFTHKRTLFLSKHKLKDTTVSSANFDRGDHTIETSYQSGKSLCLANPLYEHHHLLFLGWEGGEFLSDQAFDSLEELDIIPKAKG